MSCEITEVEVELYGTEQIGEAEELCLILQGDFCVGRYL